MTGACVKLGRSRAAFYKQRAAKQEEHLNDSVIKELVMVQRKKMPRVGGRKLLYMIKNDMLKMDLKMGRDRFFQWLGDHGLLVQSKKRYCRTTNSLHRFRVHTNLIKELHVERPHQVWVSDITYLRTHNGFCYLSLITDAHSRKIVGHHVNDTLELAGCLSALDKAMKHTTDPSGLIHHSDRGIQYCSGPYTDKLRKAGIRISMGEAGNCYENAMAERINGILKGEFAMDATFNNMPQARAAAEQAIKTYNELRPHMALQMRTPQQAHAA